MTFWVYMLHCRGGVFYTGQTDDLERRIGEHQDGVVAGFTSNRLPVELAWSQEFPTRYEALQAERQIKGWSRKKKLALIRGDWDEISRLAKGKSSPSTSSGRTEIENPRSPIPGRAELVVTPSIFPPRPEIHIPRGVIATLVEEAKRAAPEECCGLLLGEGKSIRETRPAANVADDPLIRFEIDPVTLLSAHKAAREGGAQIVGYYHSHPTGHPSPSATDCEHASGDGRIWAIVADGDVTFWRDGDGGFEPLSYRVCAG